MILMCRPSSHSLPVCLADKLSKTGEYKDVKGKSYYAADAKVAGDAFKQEAVRAI